MLKTNLTVKEYTFRNRPVKVVHSEKWVRAKFNDKFIADSTDALLLVDYQKGLGITYFFPKSAINWDFLVENDKASNDKFQFWDITVVGKTAPRAAYMYRHPEPQHKDLEGCISFKWKSIDGWFEEDEEIFDHPRDPFHRVDVIPSSRNVKVVINDETVAETSHPFLLFETDLPVRYYIPIEDVNMEYLEKTELSTHCPYKGAASYWSTNIKGEIGKNFVWAYEFPFDGVTKIKDTVSFYNEKVDIFVNGELQERPVIRYT